MNKKKVLISAVALLSVLVLIFVVYEKTKCDLVTDNSSESKNDSIVKILNEQSSSWNDSAVLFLSEIGGKQFTYATGLADRKNKVKANTNELFEIGSASKLFTAIAVLKLVEDKKLTLDTYISKFYKGGDITKLGIIDGHNHFNDVTVAMLLQHTSGFIDYLNVYGDDEKALKIFSEKGVSYSFDDIISLAVNHGDANFIPGKEFKYCNTGYIILGDIITKVSGENWREYIQKNIFDKANMTNTFFGTLISNENAKRKMRGYYNSLPTVMPPSLAGSAGEVTSNLQDLAKFLKAWQGAKFFNKQTLKLQREQGYNLMYTGADFLSYGYGVMKLYKSYGHGGQTFGFQTYITYDPIADELFVIATNDASNGVTQLLMAINN